ncbi:hypothetical protein [Ureibacillus sp. FSL W8-0352]|uniref:hypothetical protein n=1 Tax=Ureibacillus sp. FSL W8-0352 TaxID=2954596 RepID=UPI0030F80180
MITLNQLAQLLDTLPYPVSYSDFNKKVNPPFIAYKETGTNNFAADNRVWKKVRSVEVQLYTDKKDLKIEKQIEDLFYNHSIYYDADDFFIEKENLHQRIYYITTI